MPVIINHKICDQSPACGGMSVCPVGAFSYNEQNKKIEIDNKKCISCGKCVPTCPIAAIGYAKTEEEYNRLIKIIEEDPRNEKDLFVDRFGGDVINRDLLLSAKDITKHTKKGRILVEFVDNDSIKCLLKSIPVSEIMAVAKADKYYKVILEDKKEIEKFNNIGYPCLWLFENDKLLKVLPYTEENEKHKLFKELN